MGRKKKVDEPTWSVKAQLKELDTYILKYDKFARLWPDCPAYGAMADHYRAKRDNLTSKEH